MTSIITKNAKIKRSGRDKVIIPGDYSSLITGEKQVVTTDKTRLINLLTMSIKFYRKAISEKNKEQELIHYGKIIAYSSILDRFAYIQFNMFNQIDYVNCLNNIYK